MKVGEKNHESLPPPKQTPRALLAVNIIRLRGRKKWSQETLALEAGLHPTFVGHVEQQRTNVSLGNIEKIADALGVQIHVLLMPKR